MPTYLGYRLEVTEGLWRVEILCLVIVSIVSLVLVIYSKKRNHLYCVFKNLQNHLFDLEFWTHRIIYLCRDTEKMVRALFFLCRDILLWSSWLEWINIQNHECVRTLPSPTLCHYSRPYRYHLALGAIAGHIYSPLNVSSAARSLVQVITQVRHVISHCYHQILWG